MKPVKKTIHKGCGTCYYWDVEEHTCGCCPGYCKMFSLWVDKAAGGDWSETH